MHHQFIIQQLYALPTLYFCVLYLSETPRWYPYFDVVVGLVWSHDPKSYAGGSLCYW
jgi:hypothetical protein